MKLSIIVPIYNVEPYLGRCLDSLLMQDLSPQEYEIILVDDGSKDGSGAIADEYAAGHKNVRVVHQANSGVSVARNTGMGLVCGELVMFVDADDYLQPRVLKMIVEKMQKDDLDMLRFNYRFVDDNGNEIFPNKYSRYSNDYRDDVCDGATFLNERLGAAGYAWQFALKRELTRISFMRGIILGEDMLWTVSALLESKRVTSIDAIVYNYYFNTKSASQSQNLEHKRKLLTSQMQIIEQLTAQHSQYPSIRWFDGMIANTVIGVLSTVARSFYADRYDYIRRLRQLRVFPLSSYMLTPAARRKRLLINLSPRLFCCAMRASASLPKRRG